MMFNIPLDYDTEQFTKHGIDKLELMVNFISVVESENVKQEFAKFKSLLRSKLKRTITDQEEIDLLEGVCNYIKSDAGTDERSKAMTYLFNAEFLQP